MSTPLGFLPGNEYLALPCTAGEWLIDDILPLGGAMMIYGEPKLGKALATDTPIFTPSGWRTMGDLTIGDYVFAPDGTPTAVTETSLIQFGRPCYRFDFSHGESIIADDEHLWKVEEMSLGGRWTTQLRTTADLRGRELILHKKYRLRIHLGEGVQLPDQPLPLDPYCLGTWLGDGHSKFPTLTCADVEILTHWASAGWEAVKQPSQPWGYHLKGKEKGHLLSILRDLEVIGNKHIPLVYLRASRAQRLALLQGLLDTDGSCTGGVATFWNTNERLARETYDLAAGLGCKVSLRPKPARFRGRVIGTVWAVNIRAPFQVFRLQRKAARFRVNREHYTTITGITRVDSQPVKCIKVAHESHCFLAGRSCIPTHNTYLALQLAFALAEGKEWIGFKVNRPARVAYVQLDTPPVFWRATPSTRVKKGKYLCLAKEHGHQVDQVYFADRDTLGRYPFYITEPEAAAALKDFLTPIQPDVVFIDTLREAHKGDENSSQDMQATISGLVAVTAPAAIVLVHHSKKPSPDLPANARNDMRGGYSAGRMDTVFQLTPHTLSIFGRAVEDEKIRVTRRESDLMFDLKVDASRAAAERLVEDNPDAPTRELAKLLSEETGKGEEAARAAIRRVRGELA